MVFFPDFSSYCFSCCRNASAAIVLVGELLADSGGVGGAVSASILRTSEIIQTFMKGHGFLDFYIAALITGSILGMSRKLLINAAIRYLPAILGGVVLALVLSYTVGTLTGYGGRDAMFFVTIPMLSGGIGAGATPLSGIFEENLGNTAEYYMSIMVPAIALGNALAITIAGVLERIGNKYPQLTGNGRLIRDFEDDTADTDEESLKDSMPVTVENLGVGLLMATTFFTFGAILSNILPGGIHTYAWMIMSVAAAKIIGLIPEKYEICCYQWYQFIMTNLTPALLAGIGFTYTNLADVGAALSSPIFVLLIAITVISAALGAAVVGYLVGFYPIESAITAGLCMSDMGGTGDVAILSASKRMVLMPFAQISTRIGEIGRASCRERV